MCKPISSAPLDGLDAGAALRRDDEADPPPVPGKGRGAYHQTGRFQSVDVSADRRPAQFFDAREIGDADPRMLDDRRQQQILQGRNAAIQILAFSPQLPIETVQNRTKLVGQREGFVLKLRIYLVLQNGSPIDRLPMYTAGNAPAQARFRRETPMLRRRTLCRARRRWLAFD
jgi:hypothetical protein